MPPCGSRNSRVHCQGPRVGVILLGAMAVTILGWCTESKRWVSTPHSRTQRPMNFGFTLGLVPPRLLLTPFSSSSAQKPGHWLCLVWGPVYVMPFGLADASEDFDLDYLPASCSWPAPPCFQEITTQPSPPNCPLARSTFWGSSFS